MTTSPTKLLQIENLTVSYKVGEGWIEVLRDISLSIETGQSYGLVGESGSGKTTLALSLFNYLGKNGRVEKGRVLFGGQDILALDEPAQRALWGAQLSLVPQNPLSALNPSMRVGEQIAEGFRLHLGLDQAQAARRVRQELDRVHLPEPERIANSYPHQLSGGMLQRIMLAMAIGVKPRLLVLDEPTTNLDVTTQAAILELISELIEDHQTAVLYVSHNFGVIAQICDRAAVLYAGDVIEDAGIEEIFTRTLHPYTQMLLSCLPKISPVQKEINLVELPGSVPALGARLPGCEFAPRCPLAIDICRLRPPLAAAGASHMVRCHRWQEIEKGQVDLSALKSDLESKTQVGEKFSLSTGSQASKTSALELRNVGVSFNLSRTLREMISRKPAKKLIAVEQISLSIPKGSTLGLVGETGSGKTTLARAIVGLVERTAGDVELTQTLLPPGLVGRSMDTLRKIQMVFQNPDEALNPYRSVGEILRQPFMTLHGRPPKQAGEDVLRLLSLVHLPESISARRPGELSGGEKQRVAIARALATNPEVLIADESVSSLDVSVQASIINLLKTLQLEAGTTLLFISHDLAITSYLADWIAVIYLGQLVQIGQAQDFFRPPFHPYTEALLSAIPLPDPSEKMNAIRLEGEIPGPVDRPSGCPFHPRCPRYLGEICAVQAPEWQTTSNNSQICCHIPIEELRVNQKVMSHSAASDKSDQGKG